MPKTTPWNSGHDGLRCSHFLCVVTVVLLKCGLLIDRMCLASEWMTNKTDKTASPKQPHKGKPLPPKPPSHSARFRVTSRRDCNDAIFQRRDFLANCVATPPNGPVIPLDSGQNATTKTIHHPMPSC